MKRSFEKLREWRARSAARYAEKREREGRKPIPPVNAERRAKLYERNFGDHAEWIRGLPCDQCGAAPPSDPSHAIPRGMGGAGGDRRYLRPLCRTCHIKYDAHRGLDRETAVRRALAYWSRSPFKEGEP